MWLFFLISSLKPENGSGSSRSSRDLLSLSDRIVGAFNRPKATRDVALYTCKAFGRIWQADLPKIKSYGISGHASELIFSFPNDRQLQMILKKSSQQYHANAGVRKGSNLGFTLFLLYILIIFSILSVTNVICNIAIYTGDTMVLYS